MDETRMSMLGRMREGDWAEFDAVYRPFFLSWLRARGLQTADAENVAQDAALRAFRGLPGFQRVGPGSFRAWLRQVVSSALVDWGRKDRRAPLTGAAAFDDLAARSTETAAEWDAEYDRHLIALLVARVAGEFSAEAMRRFRLYALDGLSAAAVAEQVGCEPGAVYQTHSRVVARLREVAGGLLE